MTARSARRALQVAESIDLPSITTPQYVDDEGYEVDAETFALALQQTAPGFDATPAATTPLEAEYADGKLGQAGDESTVYVDDDTGDLDEEEDGEAVVEEVEVEGPREPLLSLSDSNVLNYSLMATRQHHPKHLLPHVFSHPPIPAYQRIRARPPPKGTFLWPTPPPLVHPLPAREYHGPSQKAATADPQGSPGPSTPPANAAGQLIAAEGSEPKRRKYARIKGKDKLNDLETPAHEIECLARVTLSIGPISFPGTELWVGRFVQPRAAAPKQPRVKRDKTERKRPSAAGRDPSGAKRPGAQANQPSVRPSHYSQPPQPAGAGPSGYGAPPRPPGYPQPGQTAPPRPPPPRAELSPDLIRRVNEAATKHPWLSQIIHKAARTQATKEELAKLGRVVNRLKEGKDIGEGPDDPPPATSTSLPANQPAHRPGAASSQPGTSGTSNANPVRPPPHPAPIVAPVPQTSLNAPPADSGPSGAASNASEPLTPPPQEDDSDGDSDVDMTGPRQVGGGLPGGVDPALASTGPSGPPPSGPVPSQVPHSQVPANMTPRPQQPPSTAPTADSSSFTAPSYQAQPSPAFPSTASAGLPVPPYNTTPQPTAPPPPPSRPTYPLPPPFLLVAFKEALTEKFLLPLGSLSYISRLGEKEEVTAAAPAAATAPSPVPGQTEIVAEEPRAANGPVKSRTRASLGRHAKPASPPPPPPVNKVEPNVPEIQKPAPPQSGLPPVPGTAPPDGTVLLSTFIPAAEWRKPDWRDLSKSLPFNNPLFEKRQEPQPPTTVKTEEVTATSPDFKPNPISPRSAKPPRRPEHAQAEPLPVQGKLLNLATESFMPEESEVHAVTIRLSDVSDQVWQRIKTISGMITTAEMKSLSELEPDLMADSEAQRATPVMPSGETASVPPSTAPNTTSRQPFQPTERLRESYATRKRNLFRRLLGRVPPRKFLRFRLSSPRPDIVDATVDKWAPRPYPISTKALYTREDEEDVDDAIIPLSPDLLPKKGNKKGPEPTVTFEMPVSLDQLDEMVAENALKGKKIDGRKRHGKRWIPGTICEGCGEANKRVWRAGPGGKSTLCNSCADKWTSGTLGPLAAPGAASKDKDQDAQPTPEVTGAGAEAGAAKDDVSGSTRAGIADGDRATSSAADQTMYDKDAVVNDSDTTKRQQDQAAVHENVNGTTTEQVADSRGEDSRMEIDPPPALQIDEKQVEPEIVALEPIRSPAPDDRADQETATKDVAPSPADRAPGPNQ